jgi:hypothetical protein
MAQAGDTVTYTFSDGTSVTEDVSGVDEATVDFCDGAGGNSAAGGRVVNATIDLSNQPSLYIWVASPEIDGRYEGESGLAGEAPGSTEVSFSNTESSDSADEPFLVAAGGGASSSSDAARGGGAEGTPPPLGGSEPNSGVIPAEGAIDDQNRGLVSGGRTITGGGSGTFSNGEVQITYGASVGPDAPTNLSVSDTTVEDELTLNWDEASEAAGYFVYRAESSGAVKSDYTQIADVTAPPYTDTGLEDGEEFYYRVSSHD